MNKYTYFRKKIEKGQFLVLFALLLIVFLAIIAFAVDGGRVYVEQRRTQNAADNAALGTALALCRGQENYLSEGFTVANENGYDNNGTSNTVTINIPPVYGDSAGRSGAIEAIVQSEIPSTFANIIGISSFDLTGRAVTTCETGGAYAIFAWGQDCDKQIEWPGSNTVVNGDVHSNNNIVISGSGTVINGIITRHTTPDVIHPSTTINPSVNNPRYSDVLPYPVDFQAADYAPGGTRAIAAGSQYYDFTETINNGVLTSANLLQEISPGNWVLSDGLYYTTEDMYLSFQNVTGNNVTFVAGGIIDVSGSDQELLSYVDDLLAFSYNDPGIDDPDKRCSEPIVKFAGSDNAWEGIIFTPHAVIDMSGSDASTYSGSLIGYTIDMPGSDLGITVIEDEGNPEISLIE